MKREPKTLPKGTLVVDAGTIGPALSAIDDDFAGNRRDRKRGPGKQVYMSLEAYQALSRYARKKDRFLKGCLDEAVVEWLRARGVEVELPKDRLDSLDDLAGVP